MSHAETIAVIKDSLFERVMGGEDMRMALVKLHFEDGFAREDIIQAFDEMRKEAAE